MKTIQKLLIVLVVLTLIVGVIAFVGKPAIAMAGHTQPATTYTSASVAWLEVAAKPEAEQIVRLDPGPSEEQSKVAWNS